MCVPSHLCPALCDPMDCSSSGSFLCPSISYVSWIDRWFFTTWEAHISDYQSLITQWRALQNQLISTTAIFFDSACKIFDINNASLITCIWHESKTLLRISVFESKLFLLLKKKKQKTTTTPQVLNFKRVSSHLELYS